MNLRWIKREIISHKNKSGIDEMVTETVLQMFVTMKPPIDGKIIPGTIWHQPQWVDVPTEENP